MKRYTWLVILTSMNSWTVPTTVHEVFEQARHTLLTTSSNHDGLLEQQFNQILQGTLTIPGKPMGDEAPSQEAVEALGTVLAKTPLGKAGLRTLSKVQRYFPMLTYTALAHGALTAWQEVHHTVRTKKETMHAEDKAIQCSKELAIAQTCAVDSIIHLVFLLYCPWAHPCERMYALYLLNTLHLLGSQGVALQRYLARSNRFYFTSEGILRGYDPTKGNHLRPKRIKALMKFLRTICPQEKQYRHYLALGISYGISGLKLYTQEPWCRRESTFGWHYAAGLFKALSTIDVIDIRTVTPDKIWLNQRNTDFLKLMILCALDGHPKERWHEQRAEAAQLMLPYQYDTVMSRFFRESGTRYEMTK